VALPACAGARRAAARLLLAAGPPAVQQSIDISCPLAEQLNRCYGGVLRDTVCSRADRTVRVRSRRSEA